MFWSYCPKNPNFKFQFQPLSNKIGRGKNLAYLIGLDRWKGPITKTCVIHELRRYSLLENTFLFWNFVEINLLICQNEWSNKTLDSNPKILLIILKGNQSYVLKKCMLLLKKYLIVTKAKWKTVKHFDTA